MVFKFFRLPCEIACFFENRTNSNSTVKNFGSGSPLLSMINFLQCTVHVIASFLEHYLKSQAALEQLLESEAAN
jgi:hypothetical protein